MNMSVFKIRFDNNGILSVAIILAEDEVEAYKILRKDYQDYGIEIEIEEHEIITEPGVALTWHEPIK